MKIYCKAYIVFKYPYHSRQCRKEQEEEEQGPPNLTPRHGSEDMRQRYKDESRTAVWCHTICKAGRENYKSRQQCDKGVQSCNDYCFSCQSSFFIYIASEDFHAAHSYAQSKEALIHCSIYYVYKSYLFYIFRVRLEIKG